jgi:hypothetical protein
MAEQPALAPAQPGVELGAALGKRKAAPELRRDERHALRPPPLPAGASALVAAAAAAAAALPTIASHNAEETKQLRPTGMRRILQPLRVS